MREVTIKPNGIASLIVAKVERTPQQGSNTYEWYTLSFWEFGKEAPFTSQLWQRHETLRFTVDVEVHCGPPARSEPTRHTIEVSLNPPTAKLGIVAGPQLSLPDDVGPTAALPPADDLIPVRGEVIGPMAAEVADELEAESKTSAPVSTAAPAPPALVKPLGKTPSPRSKAPPPPSDTPSPDAITRRLEQKQQRHDQWEALRAVAEWQDKFERDERQREARLGAP